MSDNSMTCTFPSEKLKMPLEPCPLPSLGSDEESFVVLGKSLTPDTEDNSSYENDEPIGTAIVEEAKRLINKEISAMEQMSMANKLNLTTSNSGDLHVKKNFASNSSLWMEKRQSNSQLEDSTILPEMPHVGKGFDTSNTISIATFPSDLTSEEVQNKISQIIDENVNLKDTILQNNMSMKSQYERIVAWQEDVQKVHQAHREKIIEAKEFIEKLKKENCSLSQNVEHLKEITDKQNQELQELKNAIKDKERQSTEKLIQSTDNNIKEFELDIANKKIRELEQTLQNLTQDNLTLKSEKEKLQDDMKNIKEKDNKDLQEELDSTKKQLEELKNEIVKVRASATETEKSLTMVNEDLKIQLTAATSQYQANLTSPEELANTRTQLAETQITLTQVVQSRAAAYAQINTMKQEIEQLNLKIEQFQFQTENNLKDEMYALQTQLEVYKADFEAERNAKEIMKEEKEKIAEDLQNLQRRNQQLQEEIEIAAEHRDFHIYPSTTRRETVRSTSAYNASAPSDSPPSRRYACPVCNLQFRSLRLLEEHVDMCIRHRS